MRIRSDTHEDFAGNSVTRYYNDGVLVGRSVTRKASDAEQLFGEEDVLTEVYDASGNQISTLRTRENTSILASLGLADESYVDVSDHRDRADKDRGGAADRAQPAPEPALSHLPPGLASQMQSAIRARAMLGPNLKIWVPAMLTYLVASYFLAKWYGSSPDQGILGMLLGLLFLPGMIVLWILSLIFGF